MLNNYLLSFKNRTNSPDIVMLYRLKWAQIEGVITTKALKILDFGSGFGTTANYFAKDNAVTAIEPNASMVEAREQDNDYRQIVGNYLDLKGLESESFDLIICHNVLEFAAERADIVKEFSRLLKVGGVLSVVKNNQEGRILSRAVLGDLDSALDLIGGGHIENTFGVVSIYAPEKLALWGEGLTIEKTLALQTFYGLQGNHELKTTTDWHDQMFELEMKVADHVPYKLISLFNHIVLRKS